MDALGLVKKFLRLNNDRALAFAGNKDKRAITTQWVTAERYLPPFAFFFLLLFDGCCCGGDDGDDGGFILRANAPPPAATGFAKNRISEDTFALN